MTVSSVKISFSEQPEKKSADPTTLPKIYPGKELAAVVLSSTQFLFSCLFQFELGMCYVENRIFTCLQSNSSLYLWGLGTAATSIVATKLIKQHLSKPE